MTELEKALAALKELTATLSAEKAKFNIAIAEAAAKLKKATEANIRVEKPAPARLSVRNFCEKYVDRDSVLYLYTDVAERNPLWSGMAWRVAGNPDVEQSYWDKCPYENWEVVQVVGVPGAEDWNNVALVIKSPTGQEGEIWEKETVLM